MYGQNQYYHSNHSQYRMMNHFMGNPYYQVYPTQSISSYAPNPYYQQYSLPNQIPFYPGGNVQQVGASYPSPYSQPYLGSKGTLQSIFQNPLEPQEPYGQQMNMNSYAMNYNPYPKPNAIPKPNSGLGSIMNSFKGQDGSIDLNKMMNTAGQMVNAVSQVSSMVKGLGGMFKV